MLILTVSLLLNFRLQGMALVCLGLLLNLAAIQRKSFGSFMLLNTGSNWTVLSAAETEGLDEKELAALIEAALSDAPRPGTLDTFTTEQLIQVVAVACEDPRESEREISHWTPRELAEEVIQRQIDDL